MLNEADKEQKEFFDNHMTCKEVLDFLKPRDIKLRYLKKVKIPHGYPLPYKKAHYMYNKKEVYEAKAHNDFVLANCRTQEQVVEYLDTVTHDTNDTDYIMRLIKEFKLEVYKMIGFGYTKYFKKDQIEEIKAKQNKFWREHIGTVEIKKIYPPCYR
ncbi:hypothetical protein [Clostridium ljungdahlii]|uniref:Uncharacterized protein n=1 Tax=Clostridium ljungdahlii TaxID=1538 RepID=A0A168RBF2_9CLOT|nr:hypothetical protein [Clostridium ljungdahlii]OAA90490.1 hypothetical protein WY13_01394 [Clostridium ljungdahlii]